MSKTSQSIKTSTAKYFGAVLAIAGVVFGSAGSLGVAMLAPVGAVVWAGGYIREALENKDI